MIYDSAVAQGTLCNVHPKIVDLEWPGNMANRSLTEG